MADILAGETYVASDSRPNRDRMTQRILVVIIVILCFVLAGELLYHLVVAPRLRIERIELESNLNMSDEQLLALAGVHEGAPYFSIDPALVVSRLEAHPMVRRAQVETIFPNRVSISVTRRQPLAAALATTESGTVPLVFDEEGVVFQVGLDGMDSLPIVSGLRFAAATVGLRLPPLVVDFLVQLRRIRMDSPQLYGLFSEYRIVQKNEYAYEVVLYPVHYQLPVRIGTSIDADMIEYVIMMLDILQNDGRISSLVELDFRSGEGVLRSRQSPPPSADATRGSDG